MVTTKERANLVLHNELLKRAEELIPVLKARSEAANEDRRIPKETIKDFKDAGFFKILQPKRYGGYELDPHTFSEVQLRVAQGCKVYLLRRCRPCWSRSSWMDQREVSRKASLHMSQRIGYSSKVPKGSSNCYGWAQEGRCGSTFESPTQGW